MQMRDARFLTPNGKYPSVGKAMIFCLEAHALPESGCGARTALLMSDGL